MRTTEHSVLRTLLRVGDHGDQPGLFDDESDRPVDDGSDGPELVIARSEPLRVPSETDQPVCRLSANVDDWTESDGYSRAASVCRSSCPFMQWCAKDALDFSSSNHLVGVWAGVDFEVTDRGGRYRRRIQKLEFIARTGSHPIKRRGGPRAQQPERAVS